MKMAEDEVIFYANKQLRRQSKALNESLQLNESLDYWRIQIMPWIIILTESIILIYKRLRNLFSEPYNNISFSVDIIYERAFEYPKNTIEFANIFFTNDYFNYWILSQIIKMMRPANVDIHIISLADNETDLVRSQGNKKAKLPVMKSWLYNLADTVIDKSSLIVKNIFFQQVYGLTFLDKLDLSIKVKRQTVIFNRVNYHSSTDVKQINDNVLEDILNYLHDSLIPKTFLKRDNVLIKNKRFISVCGPALYFNESFKRMLAANYEQCQIIGSQHGSGYGDLISHPYVAEVEYNIVDTFLTWGWEKQSNYKVNALRLPSPLLSKLGDSYRNTNNNLIFVSPNSSFYSYQLPSGFNVRRPMELKNQIEYFIGGLRKNIRKSLYYRPYPGDRYFEFEKQIQDRYSDIKLIPYGTEVKSFHRQLRNCKMVVMMGPSTTFLICMAMNVPGIYIWENYPYSEQAKEHYEIFKDVGVLYSDPEEAAGKVNDIWPSVNIWWNSDAIQSARKIFCQHYAYYDKDWKAAWLKFFS